MPAAHLADGVAAAQAGCRLANGANTQRAGRPPGQPRTGGLACAAGVHGPVFSRPARAREGGRAHTPRAGGHLADGVAAEQLVDAAARRTRLGREMRGDRVTGSGATRSNRWP